MNRRYNISEIARTLNISNELLRHYERKGLIKPIRDENGYRNYTIADLKLLTGVRRFRNMGFTLEQAEKLIYSASFDDAGMYYAMRCSEIEQEIETMQILLQSVKELTNEMDSVKKMDGICTRQHSPHVLWLPISDGNGEIVEEVDFSWVDKMPMVQISPFCKMTEYINNESKIHFGYAISPCLAKKLGLSRPSGIKEFTSAPSVCVNLHSCGDVYLSAKLIRSYTETYFLEKGLILAGDIWGITIGNYVEDGKHVRCHKVFLPVK